MEITTPVTAILEHKGPELWNIQPTASVYEAIALMAEKNVGALPVLEDGALLGMISERDYSRKVILQGRASKDTKVADIMSKSVHTVSGEASVESCLEIMTKHRVRHLPVMDGAAIVGILSVGDLVNWIISAQANAIDDLHRFVTGEYPA